MDIGGRHFIKSGQYATKGGEKGINQQIGDRPAW